jgi:hypothetical protein
MHFHWKHFFHLLFIYAYLFYFPSEYSNTESSDDVKQEKIGQMQDEDEFHFYDTRQSFSDCVASPDIKSRYLNTGHEACKFGDFLAADKTNEYLLSSSKRRSKLPEPVEKEKSVSLWSMIKDNVGKDLTRVCLPVYFNEPISSLQKCFEELEYSFLLDRAYECGLRVCLSVTSDQSTIVNKLNTWKHNSAHD